MTRRQLVYASLVASVCFPPFAQANISCTGPVTYLGSDATGLVYVAVGGEVHAVCNSVTQGDFQSTPQACKQDYAMLLADQATGKSVTLFYNDPALTQCSQVGSWSLQPSMYFVATSN